MIFFIVDRTRKVFFTGENRETAGNAQSSKAEGGKRREAFFFHRSSSLVHL
jgi:hypothetical protein